VSLPFSTLQQVVLEFGKEIILATAKVHRQKAITASFDDDTRIPKSARVSFTLNGSKTVAGTATFIAATEAITALIADFQKGIAAQVKIVAGLELLAVQLDRAKLIYRSICIWVNTAAILSPLDYDATLTIFCMYHGPILYVKSDQITLGLTRDLAICYSGRISM
jgi:hypothetical protein